MNKLERDREIARSVDYVSRVNREGREVWFLKVHGVVRNVKPYYSETAAKAARMNEIGRLQRLASHADFDGNSNRGN